MIRDVICFPVIDWSYRLQRPQQLAIEMARRGSRIFYLMMSFAPSSLTRPYLFWSSPTKNVYIVQLRCPEPHPNLYKQLVTAEQADELRESLDALRENCDIRCSLSIVDLPFWHRIASGLSGNIVVYDCMDYHPGFLNNEQAMLDEEEHIIKDADLVLTTSASLSNQIGMLRDNTLIRNACDVSHFMPRPDQPVHRISKRPVIGYFGAIDHWYDIDLVVKAARVFPTWDFVLIGRSHGCDVTTAKSLPNIHLLGELPYADLPKFVHGFDVCMIPFKISDLTLHTNPVKLYEYLAAGKPVVGTAMPEIMIGAEGLVYVANSHDEFIEKLAQALVDHARPSYVKQRIEYAKQHTWAKRIDLFENALSELFPRVTVIVLTYNNLDLTKKCLLSIENNDDYNNLELIIVDNASTDGSQEWLTEFAHTRTHVKLILNDKNLGFAAGNNRGLEVATGEYLVLLNNDTQVTRGWIFDLIRHLRKDPKIGLIGPVTNNIGNEAKVDVKYDTDDEIQAKAHAYTRNRRLWEISTNSLAFFCAMMPRAVYNVVGPLDECFTVGMFEDDDYCRRVEIAGYRIAIADDVFVHHELSASLNALGQARRREIFEQNKSRYEEKWGAWTPHRYREKTNA
jgi:GT2 family glycosyltransferase/glycosyltransferase involved in cell wall biosynthesis